MIKIYYNVYKCMKLSRYGITNMATIFIGRQQQVILDGSTRESLVVNSGIYPQGTTFAPLYYCSYVTY